MSISVKLIPQFSGLTEYWLDIKEYEGLYQISSLGRVRSLDRYSKFKNKEGGRITKGKILKPFISTSGYKSVSLTKNNRKNYYIHRLVALAFIPNSLKKLTVNHMSGDNLDNRACNLEWATQAENNWHAWETGLKANCGEFKQGKTSNYKKKPSEENKRKKLTEADVLIIRNLLARDISRRKVASRFGVSYNTIASIAVGKTWKYVE